MLDPFQQLQHSLADYLPRVPARAMSGQWLPGLADATIIVARPRVAWVAGVPTVVDAPGLEEELNKALTGLTLGPTGKAGVVIKIMMPTLSNSDHLSATAKQKVQLVIEVHENILVDMAAGGTGISAEAYGLSLLDALHGWRPSQRWELRCDESSTLTQEVSDDMTKVVTCRFFTWYHEQQAPVRVARPEWQFDQNAGTLEITCAQAGASIYYTTDGTPPGPDNANAVLYTDAIDVTATTRFVAQAYKDGMAPSDATLATITVADTTPTPWLMEPMQALQHAVKQYLAHVPERRVNDVLMPALGVPKIIIATPRMDLVAGEWVAVDAPSIQGALEDALQGLSSGPTDRRGVCITVMAPKLDNTKHLARSRQQKVTLTLRIWEHLLTNTAEGGTGVSAEAWALSVLQALHFYCPNGKWLFKPEEGATLQPIVTGIPGVVVMEVSLFTWWHETAPARHVERVGLSVSGNTVTLSCGTEGAAIYYTLDETFPFAGNNEATLYSGPFSVEDTRTVRAVAYKDGLLPSDVAERRVVYATITGEVLGTEGGEVLGTEEGDAIGVE